MKKLFIALLIILFACAGAACSPLSNRSEYLRIHIRANSDSETDQSVKYSVRDAVIRYLTPYLKNCSDFDTAISITKNALDGIVATANGVLASNGKVYQSAAHIGVEDFPSRTYEGMTLPKGKYTALVVELGTGDGDNWWCVAYPPLCFGGDQVTVKSKILEWIKSLCG